MLRSISYLVSDSDPRHAAPGIGVSDTGKIALLKAKVWQRRKRLTPAYRTNDPAGVNKVRWEAASVRRRINNNGLFLRGRGRGVDIVSRRRIRADMSRLNRLRDFHCRVGHGGGSMGYRGLDLDVWGGCWSRPHTNWSGREPWRSSARQKDAPPSPPRLLGPHLHPLPLNSLRSLISSKWLLPKDTLCSLLRTLSSVCDTFTFLAELYRLLTFPRHPGSWV